MLSKKLKVLSAIVLAAFVLVMTQMPIASAKSVDDSPFRLASLVKLGGDRLAFFSFSAPAAGDKTGDADKLLAPEECQPAPANLVSWYRGEGSGSDSQGTNNGALQNGVSFAGGKVGRAFNFTALNQSVEIPDNASLDLTNAITLEAWIAPSQLGDATGGSSIISKADLSVFGNQPYALFFNSSGRAVLRVGNSTTFSTNTVSTSVLPLNSFTHVVGTYDGITAKLYINGVKEIEDVVGIGAMATNNFPVRIGANDVGSYLGKIDEPSIYNRALTDAEIQSIFNAGSAGKCFSCTPPPLNQVSWYRGENSGSDSQGTNNGILQNGTTFAAGKVGQALSFDGVDDFVQLPNNASLNPTSITVEGWINANQTQQPTEGGWIYANRQQNISEGFSVGVDSDQKIKIVLRTSGGVADVISLNSFQPGVFQHIAVTYNETTGTLSAFVNGLPVTLNIPVPIEGQLFGTNEHFIGQRENLGNLDGRFKGLIDELSLHNRALSASEIQAIYAAGSAGKCVSSCTPLPTNGVSWYRAENNANDSQGSNNGTISGATFAAGQVGQAFNFDGADDSIRLPLTQTYQNITLETWVKPLTVVSDPINQELIIGQASFGSQIVVLPGTDGGMRVKFQFRDTVNSFVQLISTTDIPLNSWSHLSGTYDGTTLKLYINGVLNAQLNPPNTAVLTCGTPYFIGGFQPVTDCNNITNQPSQFFNGLIDEASIYNRALSQTEIQAIFNAGNAGKCFERCVAPSSNLVSWYRSENNAADVLNANNGTLQNGATFAAGKVGQSFSFDGIDDFVQLPSGSSLNPASTTVEGWIKPELVTDGFGGFIYASRNPLTAEGFSVTVGTDNSLLVNIRAANSPLSPPTFFSAPNVIQNGQFQHVAVTYNATGGTLTAYVNGANVLLNGGMILNGAIQPSNNHFIGRRQDAATSEGTTGAAYFKGLIDEFSIYNRALSQTEIQTIFNAGSAGKCIASPLQIAPTTANVATGATQTFIASGGTAPYAFSILTNNSGGSINASSGVYTAGNSIGADTVRVTEAAGATANATVNVTAACVANQKTWDGGGATNNWSDQLNWTCDVVPTSSETVIFDGTSIKNATIDANISIGKIQINSGYTGTIAQGASNVTLGGAFGVAFTQAAGTFGGGSGAIVFNGNFNQSGGTFNATTGTATINGGVFERGAGATFNHNGGTFVFTGNSVEVRIVSGATATQNFGNLTIATPGGLFGSENDTLRVNGTLNLNNGAIFSIIVEALSSVNVANTFGNGTEDPGAGKILFSGSATRIVTLPVLSGAYNAIELNAPFTTINLSGAGEAKFAQLNLIGGTFNAGTTGVKFHREGGFSSTQSGGIFDCGSGIITYAFGSFTQTGGSYNCQNATISSTTAAGLRVFLNGGTFNAPTGTMTFNGGIFERGASGTFNHNGGTVVFAGNSVEVRIVNGVTATQEFGNLTVNTSGGLFGSDNDPLRVNENLSLSGQAFSVNFFALRNVDVPGGFSTNTSTHVTFTGSGNQTFTNGGGANAAGNWMIDKPSGTVTAATSLILGASQPLNITSGTLYLNNNSNLTTGALTVGANGKLVNESATTITLGGNVINSGAIDLQGGGAACPENDTILIRSSNTTQRTWTGTGRYRLVDVDVQNMGGTGTKTVFSGTNSGGNSANWVFNPNCPTALAITPSTVSMQTGTTQTFTAGGGFPAYVFSILTNNSGGSINPTTGVYTAGTTVGTTDTIRVTDAFGATADATVSVFGTPNKLAFSVQPTNTVAGQTIAPPIQVAVQDQFGNTITNSTASVTIALQNNPAGATLSGTLTRNAVNGIATFDNLSVNRTSSSYTLRAISGSLTQATSNSFDIAAGAANRLAFVVQPSNASQNQTIAPPVQTAIQDQNGNVVTSSNDAVTISIGNNPSGGTLTGTIVRNAVGGVVTFDDLKINNAGNGYTLITSSGVLTSATSAAFDIINPFGVTNTNDSGAGSLRQAIINSNNAPGTQTIFFNIAGSMPFIINLTSNLLNITDSVVLDATTQPGYSGTPIVEIRKGNIPQQTLAGINLSSAANGSAIRGFLITGFNQSSAEAAVSISSTGNQIQANIIRGNGIGIRITANNNLIGGVAAAQRNVISGNVFGVQIESSFNQIKGNFIGTNETGTAAQGNSHGISLNGRLTGTSSNNNLIGGSEAGAKNVISGNSFAGVSTFNNSGADILGNFIGTGADGAASIPNGTGIILFGAAVSTNLETKIGGANGGEGNLIAFNSNAGISLPEGSLPTFINRIRGNSIRSNGGLGIDLGNNGVTPNDPRDLDLGVNERQNFPVLGAAVSSPGNTMIGGTLNSTPSRSFTLDFYSNSSCDFSGNGEGETFIGSTTVATDAGGIAGFTANLPVTTAAGRVITATATDSNGNTSEFSRCSRPVAAAVFSISGRIADNSSNPISGVFVRVAGTNFSVISDSNGFYVLDNIPGGTNLTLVPSKTNYTFAPGGLSFNNLSANQTNQNFVGTAARFRLSGQIRSVVGAANFALSGVTVTLGGAANASAATDQNGNYAFDNLLSGNYTVTPSKPNFTFNPASKNVALNSNQTADFTAGLNPPLEGRVFHCPNQLFSMNADGSANTQIVTFGTNEHCSGEVSASRSGRKIAYYTNTNKIFAANADGTAPSMLLNESGQTAGSVIQYHGITIAPNAQKIAFVRRFSAASTSNTSLRVMNADGTNLTTVFAPPTGEIMDQPDFSPDGNKVVFTKRIGFAGSAGQVFVINADGTNLMQLTTSLLDSFPHFSPNGEKIAFIRSGRIFTMNADGTAQTPISADTNFSRLAWSPDGARLMFVRSGNLRVGVMNANGSNPIVFANNITFSNLSWAADSSVQTPIGTNVNVAFGSTGVTFGTVSTGGVTTITPIPSGSAGAAPNGFSIGQFGAFEISTTANYAPPVTICLTVPTNTQPAVFNRLNILHNENGVLVNRTVSRNFGTRTICASVSSLSPFVIAEQIAADLPRISGSVISADGNPLGGVSVSLSGAENRATQTDSDGAFIFVNLTAGGNYNVSPKQIGYLFTEYNQDFVNLTGERAVVFTGAASSFQISGQITNAGGSGLSNVTVELGGAAQAIAQTDASGNYVFTNLPADGFYTLMPSNGVNIFSPATAVVDPLTQDAAGVNFQSVIIAPTAATVTVGGRVTTVTGRGVARARVSLTGADGTTRFVQTNPFGYYRFADAAAGETCILVVRHKLYRFENNGTLVTAVNEDTNDLNFTTLPPN